MFTKFGNKIRNASQIFVLKAKTAYANTSGATKIFGLLILAGILTLVGCFVWLHYHQTVPLGNHAGATADNAEKPTPQATGPSEAQLQLGFVAPHSGGSPWRAIARQLRADPKTWGYSGDPNDKKALTKWVNHEATVDIIRSGKYYHGIGDEVRTYGNVSYVLQKDTATGKTQIAEYAVSAIGYAGDPTIKIGGKTLWLPLMVTNTLAPSIATSHFYGASATTGEKLPVPSYEYVYFPKQ